MFLLLNPFALFLALFLALFIVSIFADRVLCAGTLARWSFGFSFLPLFWAMVLLMFGLFFVVVGTLPSDLGFIDFFKWMISKFGGWSGLLAALHFCAAMAGGVMYLLAWFVDAVEPKWYGFFALVVLWYGIVFLVGFFVILKGLALILGIVSTIIAIMVGLRKLASQNKG